MKTILSIIVCLFLFVGVKAQEKTVNMPGDYTFSDMTFVAATDTLGATRTSYTIQINAEKRQPATQDVLVKLVRLTGGKGTVTVQGSKFGTTYATVGSAVTWAGSTADTTIIISNATANRYRFYRIVVARTAGTLRVDDAKFKLYLE